MRPPLRRSLYALSTLALAGLVGWWWAGSDELSEGARAEDEARRRRAPAVSPAEAPEPVTTPIGENAPARSATERVRPGQRVVFFDAEPRPGPLARIARDLIDENRSRLGLDAMPGRLRLQREFETRSGWHLRYVQVVGDAEVYASEVSAHVAPDGRPLLVNADIHPVEGAVSRPEIDPAKAVDAVRDLLTDEGEEPLTTF